MFDNARLNLSLAALHQLIIVMTMVRWGIRFKQVDNDDDDTDGDAGGNDDTNDAHTSPHLT